MSGTSLLAFFAVLALGLILYKSFERSSADYRKTVENIKPVDIRDPVFDRSKMSTIF